MNCVHETKFGATIYENDDREFFNFQIDEKSLDRATDLRRVDALINGAKHRTSNTPPSLAAKEELLDI